MTISAERQCILLDEQTAAARKVFSVVPIQEAWETKKILQAMQRVTGSIMEYRFVEGCLARLVEAGLVKEARKGFFQQVTPRERVGLSAVTEAEFIDMTPAPKKDAKSADTLELLTELAARARALADDIEAAAVVIADEARANAEALAKLGQLQSILKSLS